MSQRSSSAGVRRGFQLVYDTARSLPDRLLHGRRHRSASRRLSRQSPPRHILVVCHANACRSPYLQAVLQRALPQITVSSAGLLARNHPVPQVALSLSSQRGLDLSRHRAKTLTRDAVNEADLLIVMEPHHALRIARSFRVSRGSILVAGDLDPTFDGSRAIQDPWNQPAHAFESSFDRLDRCAATVVGILE